MLVMVYTVDSIELLPIEFYEIFYSFISVSKFESFHRTAVVSLAAAGSAYFLHLQKIRKLRPFCNKDLHFAATECVCNDTRDLDSRILGTDNRLADRIN